MNRVPLTKTQSANCNAVGEELQKRETPEFFEQKAYYEKLLEGMEIDCAPMPDSEETEPTEGYLTRSFELEEAALKDLKAKGICSFGTFFRAVMGFLAAKYNYEKSSVIYTVCSEKEAESKETCAAFGKTLPFVTDFSGTDSVEELLKAAEAQLKESRSRTLYSFEDLAEDTGAAEDLLFAYREESEEPAPSEGAEHETKRTEDPGELSASKISFEVERKEAGNYRICMGFRKDVYTEEFAKGFLNAYIRAAKDFLKSRKLSEVSLVGEEELAILTRWNETGLSYDTASTVVELFRNAAKKFPEKDAVIVLDRHISYRELDGMTDAIALRLKTLGITKEKAVGILVPRDESMVICALAVLKAGGALLPLDSTYPRERLNLMLEDSGAVLLICDRSLEEKISVDFPGPRLYTDELKTLPPCEEALSLPSTEDLFVLLYTSGTTGLPKGIMYMHSNLMALCAECRAFYELDETSVTLQFASYGFDAWQQDVFPSLTCGGAICIVPEEMRLDLPRVFEYMKENKVTHALMTTQIARQFAALGNPGSLKILVGGGEKLASFAPPSYRFFNAYGPSEFTVLSTYFELDYQRKDIPIGKPVPNAKAYIVDTEGGRLPAGMAGELWLSGPQVTRGYLNRPEKTAEVFIPNPFSEEAGYERVVKTGDVVRFLPDGNLQFVGRRDFQVKIRGFRIELTEVEEVIRRFPGIRDAVCVGYDNPAGGKFLAAYVVADAPVDVEELNAFILKEKPPYMVPAVTMQIDAVPYTQNHKVNKRALPYPERGAEEIVLPENEIQEKIYGHVKEVLGHEEFGIDTDFFRAGLTSIGLVRLNLLLSEEFGAGLKLSEIRENGTVRTLAELLSKGTERTEYERQNDYPITQTQKGIFVECSHGADSVTYNIPVLLKLDERVDADGLEKAVRAAIDAHPYLKTTLFSGPDGDIRARRNDEDPVHISRVIEEALPSPKKLLRPYRMLEKPLYRVEIYETKEGRFLFLDLHHIIADGMSLIILLNDISRAYAGETLEAERFSGFEIALEEERVRKTDQLAKARAFYDSVFAGCETECLPPKDQRPGEACGGSLKETLLSDASEVLSFCEKTRVSVNAFFNAVFGFTVSRFSQSENVVFTTIYNGRSDMRYSDSVSMLVKTIPVLVETEADREIAEVLHGTQEQILGSMTHDLFSFAEISGTYGIRSDLMLVYQADNFNIDSLCGYPAEMVDVFPEEVKAPIVVEIRLKEGRFAMEVSYRSDYYSEKLIQGFAEALRTACLEFTRRKKLSEVSLVCEAAENRLKEINRNARAFVNEPVHVLFERHAAAQPEKIAVMDESRQLTFKELNALANRMAHHLRDLGVGPDQIVGMVLERGAQVSVTELGILKAGGAFLAMLPSYPDDRMDFCLRDAGSSIVVTSKAILDSRPELFAPDKPYRAVTVEELTEGGAEENPLLTVSPHNLVYCIYTSGTTGTPKGVMIEHHGLANFAQQEGWDGGQYYGKEGPKRGLAMASDSFDLSVSENLVHLLNGKSVYIVSESDVHNPNALAEIIKKYQIDGMSATPSLLTNYLDVPEFKAAMKQIRCIMAGAEPFPEKLYRSLKEASPEMTILNGYGPSECTIASSFKVLTSETNITIGAPFANEAYYILDRFGNILPPYGCGELIICGEQVGRGYINLPEKTAAAFFELCGMPAYHSGDYGRLNAEGEAECFGRIDDQVKLRGFRIELGEIENCICAFGDVKRSKVIVRNNGSEDYLAAFFTAQSEVDLKALAAFLREKLTYYMVPDVLMQLETMPLNPSGKIDKKALPETKKENRKSGKKAPKKSLEQEISELFASVLSQDEVYADDNFFEIGGTSLSASKVVMQLMAKGFQVEYQDIFDHPTPEDLAEYIEGQRHEPQTAAKPSSAEAKEGGHPESKFKDLLQHNALEFANEVRREPLGDVLLTGAIGFLGIHVLKELLDAKEGNIICLIRSKEGTTSEKRLKNMLMYYFGRSFEEEMKERIRVLDADIVDDRLPEVLADVSFRTIINCAAIVKHYSSDDSIERTNVHGVENLIRCAKEHQARMIQISTISIPGAHTEESYRAKVRMYENELFTILDGDNKYLLSKIHAEERMLEAIREGLDGKIIRVGNLMGRHSDGEFQINSNTNAFLSAIRGFSAIGKFPLSHSTDLIGFSPIDLTAKAIVKLSGVNREFTAFHADNRIVFDEMQLINAMNRCGIPITPVSDEEYYEEYYRLLGDEKINANLSGLLTNDKPGLHEVETDNTFSANVLYRLGFAWPLVDSSYLDRIIKSLASLDFFSLE